MKHTARKIQGLQGTHSYQWPTVSAFIFSKHFGFLRKNFITLLIILYLKLVPVRQTLVSHLPSLQRRERKNEKLKITEHQLKFSWFPGVWFPVCAEGSVPPWPPAGHRQMLVPKAAVIGAATASTEKHLQTLLILTPLMHNSGWNTLLTTQRKAFPWSPANARTGNSQDLRTGRAWTQPPLPTPCTQLVWNKPTEKFPFFIPLLTWAMGLSQEPRLHRWQESSHLCLKQNQPTLSCRNSICISPKRDGKSLIIKPIAFSRWSKKSTFKKLPRGL